MNKDPLLIVRSEKQALMMSMLTKGLSHSDSVQISPKIMNLNLKISFIALGYILFYLLFMCVCMYACLRAYVWGCMYRGFCREVRDNLWELVFSFYCVSSRA